METSNYVTTAADITRLADSIMNADASGNTGRITYLRSLLAATQTEIAGKPVIRVTGRAKRLELDQAAQAFEKVHKLFYDAVLAAVPTGLTAQERQSKTSFARSASATLRRAIATGWNPLGTGAAAVTKASLAVWTAAHSAARPITPKRAEKRVMGLVERMRALVYTLPEVEAGRILHLAAVELGAVEEPQRIVGSKLVKHEPRARH